MVEVLRRVRVFIPARWAWAPVRRVNVGARERVGGAHEGIESRKSVSQVSVLASIGVEAGRVGEGDAALEASAQPRFLRALRF